MTARITTAVCGHKNNNYVQVQNSATGMFHCHPGI